MIGQYGRLFADQTGTGRPSPFRFGNSSNKRLFTGTLRIAGERKESVPEKAEAPDKAEVFDSKPAAIEHNTNVNIPDKFAETLLLRLNTVQDEAGGKKTPESSQKLVDSITAVIEEIKNEFGQEAANRAMADIVTGTEKNVSAEAIAGAIGGALKSLADANEKTINDPSVSKEQYEAAVTTKERLQEFVARLNGGAANGDGSNGFGLNEALNGYFGLAAESQKNFTADFSWASPGEEASRAENDGWAPFTMSVKELGRETLQKFADFLRSDVGNEEAAKYLEGLDDNCDIFEAIDCMRNQILKDHTTVEPDDQVMGKFGEFFPASALARRTGEGLEQLKKVNRYLADNMVDAVNGAIWSNGDLKARMRAAAGCDGDRNQSDTYGLYNWPGSRVVGGGLCDWEYGGGARNFGECGNTTGADRFLRPMEIEVDGKRVPCVYQPASAAGALVDKVA